MLLFKAKDQISLGAVAVSTKLLAGWNVLGLLLLINVVATAIMAMPHPLQILHTDPPNVWNQTTP